MDKDAKVLCTDCINWNDLKEKLESYFGCNTALCSKCKCFNCDCIYPETSKAFDIRSKFILKES